MPTDVRNILIITSEFPPGPGGIGNQAYNIALSLKKSGYNISVYTSSRKEYDDVDFDEQHSELHIDRYKTHQPISNMIKAIKYIIAQRRKIDAVLLSGNSPILLAMFIRLLSKWRIIIIIHAHEVLMPTGIMRILTKRSLKYADNIIAVSDFACKNLLDNVNLNSEKITVISNGISLDRFPGKKGINASNSRDGIIKLVTLGSITQRKGQHNVVKALPELKNHFGKIEYHMVGIPKDRLMIEQLAKEMNVSDSIYIHGMLNDEDLYKVLSDADIFIMLSENLPNGDVEGFGIAIIEANLVGLPAIGAIGCGIDRAIDNKVTGILVDSKDTNQITNAVSEILNNYDSYRANAVKWAHGHDWNILIKDYIKTINS